MVRRSAHTLTITSLTSSSIRSYILPLARPFGSNSLSPATSASILAKLECEDAYKDATGKYYNVQGELRSSEDIYIVEKAKDLWDTSLALAELKPEETRL